ncbi:xylulose kinase 2 isoform X1 [Rosa chinensis]|uniref:xylulose kinase 2 isoform X1 n=1 Tax=Rosa chinensis TaxID=74649 RepID=UPI000D08DC79|nr:xylulose kinase 2 isoform X1 [Rosa chinensis]
MADFSLPKDSYFLGFDSSTQSLKATVLDSNLNFVTSELVQFDTCLAHYKTKDGVYRDASIDGRVVSPTLMWVEALDLVLDKLLKSHLDFGKITAVSGSGQQHSSVYWKNGSSSILSSLDSKVPLVDQLNDAFSVKESPIWMDSSTTAQCKELENAVGGALQLSQLTGSRAYERFTGPQIKKIFETHPEVYNNTERISLVSSFMASLLIGRYACIDESDGAGMSLMDIKKRTWSKVLLEATAPGLEDKLGKLAPAHAVAGHIAPYFVERYKFNKDCLVIQWSGENPNRLAGLTLSTPGDLGLSLDTSDTVFGITDDPQPGLEGHVFPNPVDTKSYIVMLCYKNGSPAREGIRNRYCEGSWDRFNTYLTYAKPLNDGKMSFYYTEHEILPPLPVGFHRYILENFTGDTLEGVTVREVEQQFDPKFDEARAVVEGQIMSMRGHAERYGMPSPPKRLIATGSSSVNRAFLYIAACVFGCELYTVRRSDSVSLGAALRAVHGWLCSSKGTFVPFSCLHDKNNTSLKCKLEAISDINLVDKYALMVKKRLEIENCLVEKLGCM